ncbi:MAG: hypothetical protein GYA24_01710 [Candidatus Lokiarchaeota archaeon]|nr:hypothetical protein [Candidatus Lokiarchaeota archaeon]
MFKKITDKVVNKATSSVKTSVSNAASNAKYKAQDAVRGAVNRKFQAFVTNLKKMNKKVNGPLVSDFEEFKAQWEAKASDPEQSVFYFLMAAYHYAQGDKDKGEWMATLILPKTHLLPDNRSPTGFKLNFMGDGYFMEHMAESPRIVNSYLGGSPENNYEIDTNNLVMHIVSEGSNAESVTIHIQSAGKDFSSPCNLRKNNSGQYKLFQIGSIATGVQKTEQEKGDF